MAEQQNSDLGYIISGILIDNSKKSGYRIIMLLGLGKS